MVGEFEVGEELGGVDGVEGIDGGASPPPPPP